MSTIQTDNIAGQDYSNYDWSNNTSGEAGDVGDVEDAIDAQVVDDTKSSLVDAANSGKLDGFIKEFESEDTDTAFANENFSDGRDVTELGLKASLLSSDEIQGLADDGRITQKQADYLKVLGGIYAMQPENADTMMHSDQYSRLYDSMANFAAQDDATKAQTISAFDDRQVERQYDWSYDDGSDQIYVNRVTASYSEPTEEAKAASDVLGSNRNWDDILNDRAIKYWDDALDGGNSAQLTFYKSDAQDMYDALGPEGLQGAVDAGKMSQKTADWLTMCGECCDITGDWDRSSSFAVKTLSPEDRQFVINTLAEGGDKADAMVQLLKNPAAVLGQDGTPSGMTGADLRGYIDDGSLGIDATISSGGTVSADDLQKFMADVGQLSADDIQAQVPDSLSQDEADWLIVATNVAATDPSPAEFSTAMLNYDSASDWARSSIADACRGRTVDADASAFRDCEGSDFSSATLMPDQQATKLGQTTADHLINATPDTVDDVPDLIGNEEVDEAFGLDDENQISREEMEQLASNNIDDFDDLSDATKDLIVDNLMLFDNPNPDVQLNSDSYVVQPKLDENGEQVVDDDGNPVFEVKPGFLTPDDIRSRDVQDADDAGQSYFQCSVNVLTESLSNTDDEIKGITAQIDDNNDTFTNCNAASSILASATASTDGTDDEYYDISQIYLSADAAGHTDTSVLEFCDSYGIDIPEGEGQYGTKLTEDQVQTLMDNIDRKKDSIDRLSSSLTTQVQTLTSQYQVTLQLLTGLIQAWKEENQSVARNIN
ncbi:MAG: hypothetical protein AAGG47_02480 [Pseudomonadota bacterium]